MSIFEPMTHTIKKLRDIMDNFINIEDCEKCSRLENEERADLLKNETLADSHLMKIGTILRCEICGTFYEEIREKDTNSDDLYRNRLSLVEAIYSLEADKSHSSKMTAQKLRDRLFSEMERLEKRIDAVNPSIRHHFLCNLAHFHHARGNTAELDRLKEMGDFQFQMILEFHRQDSPMITIKSK